MVPAHAGVVPDRSRPARHTRRGPRACGGGPSQAVHRRRRDAWSPRMRGWSRNGVTNSIRCSVVPAHAGVVPRRSPSGSDAPGGPRACGGGPNWDINAKNGDPWSPRMRGWSRHGQHLHRLVRVVPAHAGVVPTAGPTTPGPFGGPRACGGGPDPCLLIVESKAWSPRMRGWSPHAMGVVGPVPVVPAHSGVIPGPTARLAPGARTARLVRGGRRASQAQLAPPASGVPSGGAARPGRRAPTARASRCQPMALTRSCAAATASRFRARGHSDSAGRPRSRTPSIPGTCPLSPWGEKGPFAVPGATRGMGLTASPGSAGCADAVCGAWAATPGRPDRRTEARWTRSRSPAHPRLGEP